MLITEKKIVGDKSLGVFFTTLFFFLSFENDNISSSKSYMVTKSEISPQRKLGSLPNLKLKFTRWT